MWSFSSFSHRFHWFLTNKTWRNGSYQGNRKSFGFEIFFYNFNKPRRVASYTQNTQMRIHRPQKVKTWKVQKCNKNRRRRGVRAYCSRNSSETTICLSRFVKFSGGVPPETPTLFLGLLSVKWFLMLVSPPKSTGLDTLKSDAAWETCKCEEKVSFRINLVRSCVQLCACIRMIMMHSLHI